MSELLELITKVNQPESNQEIAEITELIKSQYPNQEFYHQCMQIILEDGDQISTNYKQYAHILFNNGIISCWKSVFDQDQKMILLNQIPELFAHSQIEILPLCEKLSDIIIDYSLFKDECSYLLDILPQLFQNDINYQRAGLIIAMSICEKIKRPTDEMYETFSSFASLIFPFLSSVCKESDNLILLKYCYHCLSCLLEKTTDITEQLIKEYGELFYSQFMNISMSNPENTDKIHIDFLIEGIGFLSEVSEKLDSEQIGNIIILLQNVFQLNLDKYQIKVKAKGISFLNSMIIDKKRYDIFESNMQLIMEIIFSQLLISDEDINEMAKNPEVFIEDNPQADYDWGDAKTSCCRFVLNCVNAIEDTNLIEFIYQIASSFPLEAESRNNIFTSFRLLTAAVSNKCAEYFNQYIPYLSQAFDHEDFVIRSGSFLLLSNVDCCEITQPIIDTCIEHLSDPAPIVCYYSALALAQCFNLCQSQQVNYQQYKELYTPHISQIYTSFLEISSQFNDSYIPQAFNDFVLFFKEEVLPFADALFDKITEIFITSCQLGESDFSEIESKSSEALHILIKLVASIDNIDPETFNQLYSHFYSRLCTAIEETANYQSVSLLKDPLSSLIYHLPYFNPEFWELLNPLISIANNGTIDIDDAAQIFEMLIFKDEELASRGEVLTELCTFLLSSDALISASTFGATLIMRCGQNLPCMNEIVSCIKKESSSDDNISILNSESICNITSAIFLNFEDYSELFEEGDMTLFNIWVSYHFYPFYVASFLKIFHNFDDNVEAQAQMLKSAFDSILSANNDEEEEEAEMDDDDDESELVYKFQIKPGEVSLAETENPQWFDETTLAQELYQLTSSLIESQSPVVQEFEQEDFNGYMASLSAFLEKKLTTKDE